MITIYEAMQHAYSAYFEPTGEEQLFGDKLNFSVVKNQLDFCYIVEYKDYILCSFRGTDTETDAPDRVIKKWCRNLTIEPLLTDGKWGHGTIHHGAYDAWAGIKDDFTGKLWNSISDFDKKPIIFVGHSLGAWLAILGTRHIAKNTHINIKHPLQCINFGCPNLFTLDGLMEYDKLNVKTTGILCGWDIVEEFPDPDYMYAPSRKIRLPQPYWHRYFYRIRDHLPAHYLQTAKKFKGSLEL